MKLILILKQYIRNYIPISWERAWWKNTCYLIDKPIVKKPILFFSIPKNASDSIKRTFGLPVVKADLKTKGHMKIPYIKVKKFNYEKFIIIRCPFSRVISSFCHISRFLPWTKYIKTKKSAWYKAFLQNDIKQSFNLFLCYIESDFYDQHVMPQYLFLEKNELTLDDIEYVLLQDKLEEGFNKLCQIIGFDKPLAKTNVSNMVFLEELNRRKIAKGIIQQIKKRILTREKLNYAILQDIVVSSKQQIKESILVRKRLNYAILQDLVVNDDDIRQKIKRIYSKDFTLYAKACKRALE